jgi:hypothetical protein
VTQAGLAGGCVYDPRTKTVVAIVIAVRLTIYTRYTRSMTPPVIALAARHAG